MASRYLALGRREACIECGVNLEPGTRAWWDAGQKSVTCLPCREYSHAIDRGDSAVTLSPGVIDSGVAGASSQARYEYLHARRAAGIEAKFGRLAGIVKFMTDDPQSTEAWKKGSTGERELAAILTTSVGDRAVLLHDRRVPKTRGNVDHLAIASNGVWVIDAKNYRGVIQKRDIGRRLKVDDRLFVGGKDRTKVIDGLGWHGWPGAR